LRIGAAEKKLTEQHKRQKPRHRSGQDSPPRPCRAQSTFALKTFWNDPRGRDHSSNCAAERDHLTLNCRRRTRPRLSKIAHIRNEIIEAARRDNVDRRRGTCPLPAAGNADCLPPLPRAALTPILGPVSGAERRHDPDQQPLLR
jgi:hypothetical protein